MATTRNAIPCEVTDATGITYFVLLNDDMKIVGMIGRILDGERIAHVQRCIDLIHSDYNARED